jgi:L-alanine-DL-glutamate epimerase-like enolase superfamily enzyme
VIRLDRVTLREIRLPLAEPFETSAGTVGERRILLLELADVDGAQTWSECVASLPNFSIPGDLSPSALLGSRCRQAAVDDGRRGAGARSVRENRSRVRSRQRFVDDITVRRQSFTAP